MNTRTNDSPSGKKDINSFFEYDKQELFSILLDLLGVFRKICEEHDLHFYANAGTMLGAVRHQGFIPWDDDIDLVMMRDDFDKLLALIPEMKLPEPYRFLTPLTDMQYAKGLIRLCNTNTTAISVHDAAFDFNRGIFIDIFPLDAIPDGKTAYKFYRKRMYFYYKYMMLVSRFYMQDGKAALRKGNKILYTLIHPFYSIGLITKEKVFRDMTKAAKSYADKGQKRLCLSTFLINKRTISPKADYDCETLEMPFENTTIPVPATYDRILRTYFGDNYMTPIRQKTMHGDTLYSTTIPYKEFIKTYHDELIQIWTEYRNNL